MRKATKIISIILIVIIFLVIGIVAGFNTYQHLSYKEFFSTCEKEFIIPGIDDGFVPQGITFDKDSGLYLTCGYMSNDLGSRVYYVDPNTGKYDYLNIMTHENGRYVYSYAHAGGLTIYDNYIFICTSGVISIFNKLDITTDSLCKDGTYCLGDLVPIATFSPQTGASFIYAFDDKLYIGEYYGANDYETDKSHHYTTDSGDFNQSIMTVYDAKEILESLSAGDPNDISPLYCFSITDNAQGVCVLNNGNICISSSCGLKTSKIRIYEDPSINDEEGDDTYVTDSDVVIPLYYLDSSHLEKTYDLQPMSEELYFDGNKILVMCESASNKYIFGKFTASKYCYSFIPEY